MERIFADVAWRHATRRKDRMFFFKSSCTYLIASLPTIACPSGPHAMDFKGSKPRTIIQIKREVKRLISEEVHRIKEEKMGTN